MKFSDYLSSYITPQMTLLEKFNALLKYLNDESLYKNKLYVHTITLSSGVISFIDTNENEYTIAELKEENFFDKKINLRVGTYFPIRVVHSSNYNVIEYFNTDHVENISLIYAQIVSQAVELYEN